MLRNKPIYWGLAVLLLLLFGDVGMRAQNGRLSLKMDNVTVKQVLDAIEGQTDYAFFYKNADIDVARKVSVDLQDKTIGEILSEIMPGTTHRVEGKMIVLIPKSEREPVQQKPADSKGFTVSGIVVDQNGNTVPGATVMVPGTTNGVITTLDGRFSITLNTAGVLECACLGFDSARMTVSAATSSLRFVLSPSSEQLDELVVIGYGSMRRSLVTSAISKVSVSEDMMRSVSSPAELLQGRVAGVTSFTGSGNLGSGERMSIRGASSLSASNEPLYVIDGVPIYNTEGNITNLGESMSTLSLLNLNDIESVEILKDAASAAIYGSRATNGVVLITTRSGSEQKSSLNVKFTTGLSQFPNIDKIRMADSDLYVRSYNEGVDNYNRQYGYTVGDKNYKEHIVNPFGNMEDYDWMRAITQTGHFYTGDISFAGGSKKTRFYIGASAGHHEGIIRTNRMDKVNLSTKINHQVNNWFEVGANNSVGYMKNHQVPGSNAGSNIIARAILQRPTDRPYKPDGSYYVGGTDELTFHNGIQILNEEDMYLENMRYIGSFYGTFKFFGDRLTFKNSVNTDVLNLYDYTNYYYTHPYGKGTGYIVDRGQTSINLTAENVLNYNDTFFEKGMTFNAMLGHSFMYRTYHNISVEATDFPAPALDVVGVGT